MSDPEPSVAAASSSPSLPATDSNALNYAFLVHSHKTLTQNLPPRVDNKLLARQKRRRTSPEDHAILEAEYQRNPKPDKIARARIVNRVSLGEKEVQIWFQNRRQNDRRKSKPLQPHELLAPRSSMSDSSGHPHSEDNASGEPDSSSGAEQGEAQDRSEDVRPKSWGGELLQLSDESDPVMGEREDVELPRQSTQTSVATEAVEDTPPTTQEEFHGADSGRNINDNTPGESSLQASKRKRSVSDIRGEGASATANGERAAAVHTTPVKSPPSLRLSLSFDGEAMVRKEDEMTPSPPKGRNALRIAMSSDGKAVIRAENEPSPSKNRVAMFSARRKKATGLRRSSSAVFPATPRAGMTEKDRVFGRSRDPRNWESFFDTDARSALSTPTSSQPAPNASPGVFQSRAQRSLSRSMSARHSLHPVRTDTSRTATSQGEKRRKLSRTVSSLGRLETDRTKAPSHPSKLSKSMTFKANKPDLDLDAGDSDKENWVPGTRSPQVRRRTTSHASRPALRESNPNRRLNVPGHAGGKRNRPYPAGSQGKAPPDLSAELSAFMAGGAGGSQEDDLDCVQGLLSLSQGAWR